LCYVNIILYNNVNEYNFRPSRKSQWFANELMNHDIMVTKRLERGTKIAAACGQLRAKYEK
jgi:23S rRNA (adenine2503-C2)-methyltransferase